MKMMTINTIIRRLRIEVPKWKNVVLVASKKVGGFMFRLTETIIDLLLSAYTIVRPFHHDYKRMHVRSFVEEFQLMVMPIGGRADRRPDFKITLDEPNETVEELIVSGLETNRSPRFFSEAVSDLLEDQARDLLLWHENYYYLDQSRFACMDEGVAYPHFHLRRIYGDVYNWGFFYVHFVQRKSRKNASMRGMETRTKIIPKKKLVRFTFPRSVLSNRARRRLMKKLAKLSELTPKFFFAQDLTETARRGYDSSAWHRANLVFVMRALRRVGLGNIGLISNESLEYYEIERLLTFHHSLALYREDFISQLNTILGKAGIHQKVKIEGLPTSSEIVAIKTKLRIGELDFKEAYEAVAY